ncbi:MAG TPA: HlyC/CorC family transporter [Acidiferrobacterales bacterium]
MDDPHLGALVGALIGLILLSAFFSASEIGMLTLNRYRLRHLADSGHRGARIAQRLLARPDRLLGIILLGNNAANIGASSVATVIALELYGEPAIAVAAFLLTLVILVFAEVAPKTLAALHPEWIAFPAAYALQLLLWVSYPLVWMVNVVANWFLRLFGVSVHGRRKEGVTSEELRTVVMEAGTFIPETHQAMLLAILDLEKLAVEDVMVPRGEIEGIDLDADWDDIVEQLTTGRYTRLPVYHGSLDQVVGLVHLRKVLNLIRGGSFDRDALMKIIVEPYFVPEGTPLSTQLINFRNTKRRVALVVDEYGDLLGLVTLEEILEEIVGDFTAPSSALADEIQPQDDGSYLISGGITIRDLNRALGWHLPTDGPKTLNGLITEYLEAIPESGTSLMLNGYNVEIVRTRGTGVHTARMRVRQSAAEDDSEQPAS